MSNLVITNSVFYYLYMEKKGAHCVFSTDEELDHYYDEPMSEDYDDPEFGNDLVETKNDLVRKRADLVDACTTEEKQAGLSAAADADDFMISLHATSFEEFLIRLCVTEWTHLLVKVRKLDLDAIPAELKSYWHRVYTREGRELLD
jgi:hypothetical protein